MAETVLNKASKKNKLNINAVSNNLDSDNDKQITANGKPVTFSKASKKKGLIMLIVEKGRMGSTFPSSFICFDLRARYLIEVRDFTTIIQDVGRVFGYGNRPNLLISTVADSFLKEVWDIEQDGISFPKLKKHMIKLGAHMSIRETLQNNDKQEQISPNFQTETMTCDEAEMEEDVKDDDDLAALREIYDVDKKDPTFLF